MPKALLRLVMEDDLHAVARNSAEIKLDGAVLEIVCRYKGTEVRCESSEALVALYDAIAGTTKTEEVSGGSR